MDTFKLCQRIIFAMGIMMTGFGLLLAFFNQTLPFDLLFNNQINPNFWGKEQIADTIVNFQQWIYGVLGSTIAGWGLFVAYIAHYPFNNKELWAWKCLTLGLTLWFIADTSVSLYMGVFYNTIFNMVIYCAIIIPALISRKYFKSTCF